MYQIVILSKLCGHLGQVILRRFGVLKCKTYFGTNRVSLFFFKILYCIFYSSYDIFIRRVLEVIEKLRPFARRLVLIWINCLEDINNPFLFICYISGALCCFILADQFIRFSYTTFHESFLQDSKMLPFNSSMLFLILSRIK